MHDAPSQKTPIAFGQKDLKPLSNNHGLTLTELLIVLGIFAIVASTGVPNILNWFPTYRVKAAARDARAHFQKCKVAAIATNVNCTIVFNQPVNGTTYDYVTFTDTDEDFIYDAGETTIATILWTSYPGVGFDTTQGGGDGLTFTDNTDATPKPHITFRPNSIPTKATGGFASGTLSLVNSDNNETLSVFIAQNGNIRIN